MITLCRNTERHHIRPGNHHVWCTFHPQERPGGRADDFGVLATLNEIRLPPGGGSVPHPREAAEVITYVYAGALAQEDSTGSSRLVHAGEFQRMTRGRGLRHHATNASRTGWAHFFQIALRRSGAKLSCARDQKRFATGKRHNVLCVVASPDGRRGSLRILQDALIFSSVLDPGHHLVHELLPGRSAWLHMICGEAILPDIILNQGDGVGVTIEPCVSLTAQERTEILLVDLASGPR